MGSNTLGVGPPSSITVLLEPSVTTATCSGSMGRRGRYDAMVIKASSLTDSCWYMTVSLVCPGLRDAILMNVHAPSGRVETSQQKNLN